MGPPPSGLEGTVVKEVVEKLGVHALIALGVRQVYMPACSSPSLGA